MKYLDPSFTVSTSRSRMTDRDYEIAVGLRCPKCKELFRKCKCGSGVKSGAVKKKKKR
jgi:uncharacterized C2H2 Zn-finger protein